VRAWVVGRCALTASPCRAGLVFGNAKQRNQTLAGIDDMAGWRSDDDSAVDGTRARAVRSIFGGAKGESDRTPAAPAIDRRVDESARSRGPARTLDVVVLVREPCGGGTIGGDTGHG